MTDMSLTDEMTALDERIEFLEKENKQLRSIYELARKETFAEQQHSHCVASGHEDVNLALVVVNKCRFARSNAVWAIELPEKKEKSNDNVQ